ncbi:MAG: Gfo/Idh/MocA family protein [Limisphaerales bacterium]
MQSSLSRRQFLHRTAITTVTAGAIGPSLNVLGANARVRLAFMGVNARGSDLIKGFSALEGTEIAAICDVDDRAMVKGTEAAAGAGSSTLPRSAKDVRRLLDDPDLDALVIAAPDHWHAPATILACAAGKHVYLEKPASHNAREGELAVDAARKHRRVVQLGTQRRSMARIIEAMDQVRSGALGRVVFSRAWYTNQRGSIGRGRPAPVPDGLDWNLWQGPAPEHPFQDNVVHYNWHWFWHWGTGELGNNGIHALDLCRWGLGVEFPTRVTSAGGRYHFDDDQESPDTNVVTYDFGGRMISWEGRSCLRRGIEGSMFGAAFYGEQGTLVIDGGGYRIFDPRDQEIAAVQGPGDDRPHLQNFVDCIRNGQAPNAGLAEGHRSTLLCHLGNIAWRTGRTLECDPRTGRIVGDKDASRLWGRKYRKGWEPKV